MNSLLQNRNKLSQQEDVVKEALINTLSENVREIEFESKQREQDCLELCECTSSLCTTLEAIFLHGLKDSFLWQTINVITGDVDRRPEPSFWSPVMVFLHKQVIEQIQSLTQITSEIGQCRAWIRLSLNESIFSSYLNNMCKNSSSLKPYYKRNALVKDTRRLKIAAELLGVIEASIQFNLPINSSLLNQWPDCALQMSGLWIPALKSYPINCGVDVAGTMTNEAVVIPRPQPLHVNEVFCESISSSPFRQPLDDLIDNSNKRENIDLFLQKVDEISDETEKETEQDKSMETYINVEGKQTSEGCQNNESFTLENDELLPTTSTIAQGNSLTQLMLNSWSKDVNDSEVDINSLENKSQAYSFERTESMTSSTSSLRSPLGDRCSYNALLYRHERNREIDWTEVWEKFLQQNATTLGSIETRENASTIHMSVTEDEDTELNSKCSNTHSDFEFVSGTSLEKFDIAELQEMVEQLCKLAHEPGLDAQGFLCKSCQHPLGIGYSNFEVCAFSGNYYCDRCMHPEAVLIPARIIYNWDFRKYFVSKRVAAFLDEFRNQPFIDLQLLNPDIYNSMEAMSELQSLRIRLNFIRAYLYTCSPNSIEELQQFFANKEYLYEHIHQYSIDDLAMIKRNTLNQQLQKAYKAGEAHILKCALCSVKGFICEICKSSRVLYPFHIDTTFRCTTCGAVFHPQCLSEQQPCPRCERRRKREISLLHNNAN